MLIPVSSRPKKPMIAPSRKIIVESPDVYAGRVPADPADEKRRAVIAARYVRQK